MLVAADTPSRADVRLLLDAHLADMHAASPPESVHALPADSLAEPGVAFWSVREGQELLGCGAMTELDPRHGEIKSMRTAPAARRRGVEALMLAHILDEARDRGYDRVSLETGSQEFFAPARALYSRFGFEPCPPFADYVIDPSSVFMTRELRSAAPDTGD